MKSVRISSNFSSDFGLKVDGSVSGEMNLLNIKRVYEKAEKNDGMRILVDRLWPRGLSKKEANIDLWMKDIAPGENLRKWFSHKEERWKEFQSEYLKELENKEKLVEQLKNFADTRDVTLLYSAKDEKRNNAVVLLKILKS